MTKNLFGGKNAQSLYTPMSESEQEALSRIAEKGEFVVEVKGIGKAKIGKVIIGDHNLRLPLTITFIVAGGKVKAVPFLDLRLTTTTGIYTLANLVALRHRRWPLNSKFSLADISNTKRTGISLTSIYRGETRCRSYCLTRSLIVRTMSTFQLFEYFPRQCAQKSSWPLSHLFEALIVQFADLRTASHCLCESSNPNVLGEPP